MTYEKGTGASLFSGGEGWGVGVREAGIKPVWGIEIDPAIATVANRNLGEHVITADVLTVDPAIMAPVEFLHASPPCPNFSNAKQGGKESDLDIALARKTAQFVDVLRPRVFTLENVYLYRRSESWAIIRNTLYECGYWMDLAHVNAADYGVPQTRKRMIVRAIHGAMVPYLPEPEPWVGWYEAIEDLIPTLPESEFAPWQLKRLPDTIRRSAMFSNQNSYDHDGNIYGTVYRDEQEPAVTVRTVTVPLRAFIANNAKTELSDGTRMDDEPALAVTQQSLGRSRAWLLTGQYDSPAGSEVRRPQARVGEEPSNTVTASNRGDWRVCLMDLGNTGRAATTLEAEEPSMTVQKWHGRRPSHAQGAWLGQGKVVQLTPRCLARFQTFPDWYKLPDSRKLAATVIGNAVPCRLAKKLTQQLLEV